MPRPPKIKFWSFYKDENYGVLKLVGERNGKYLFETFVKSPFTRGPNSGWQRGIGVLELDSRLYRRWMNMGKVKSILPPE